MTTYRKPVLGIAALLGALLLGGCSQLGFGDDKPDASGGSASGESSADAKGDGVKFAQCMRDNGVDVPDPKGEEGAMPALPRGGDEDDTVKKALEKCDDLMPMPEDDRSDEEIFQDNLEMANCLRDNGVDVEDPKKGEGLALDLSGDQKKMEEAMKACGEKTGGGPSITMGKDE
ncbi:hypothetical protein NOGI109294_05690 [Nocardiopsis gilva]|nr:hypothetical protein [Nocardiopsis gilva]